MENFNWTSFTKKIAIKASMPDLYNAWTVPSEIERWFLENAHYEKPNGTVVESNENIQPNDNYQWSWFLFNEIENGKILEANGKDLLKFTFAGDCEVEVRLSQEKAHVIVMLTQNNIPTDDQSKKGIRLGCESGWSFLLVNLKSISEGGIDLRNKEEGLTGMLNN